MDNLIKDHYLSGKRGRPTIDIETMLRMYLMQNRSNLSNVKTEDAIYDRYAMKNYMYLDFLHEQESMRHHFYNSAASRKSISPTGKSLLI